jgi:hypothetical protein
MGTAAGGWYDGMASRLLGIAIGGTEKLCGVAGRGACGTDGFACGIICGGTACCGIGCGGICCGGGIIWGGIACWGIGC